MDLPHMCSQSRHGREGLLTELAAKPCGACTPYLAGVGKPVRARSRHAQMPLVLIFLPNTRVGFGAVSALERARAGSCAVSRMVPVLVLGERLLVGERAGALVAVEGDSSHRVFELYVVG